MRFHSPSQHAQRVLSFFDGCVSNEGLGNGAASHKAQGAASILSSYLGSEGS